MARYTYRHIEVRKSCIDGWANKLTDDVLKYAKEGQTWCINGEEYRYYTLTDGQWIGKDKPESKWILCTPSIEVKRPALEKEQYPEHYMNPWKGIRVLKEDDNERYFKTVNFWANNGGAIRDEYLSDYSYYGSPSFAGKGLPNDASPELIEALKEDGELPNYHYTHITLEELEKLYNSEETRILGLLKESYTKMMNDDINRKLDYIISHMKDPMKVNPDDLNKKESDDEDDDDGYYDSPDFIIDEYMPNLYLLAQEIAKANYIAEELYEVYGSDNVRITYYVC